MSTHVHFTFYDNDIILAKGTEASKIMSKWLRELWPTYDIVPTQSTQKNLTSLCTMLIELEVKFKEGNIVSPIGECRVVMYNEQPGDLRARYAKLLKEKLNRTEVKKEVSGNVIKVYHPLWRKNV